MAGILMERKLKKCSFVLEQQLTEVKYLASLPMVKLLKEYLISNF